MERRQGFSIFEVLLGLLLITAAIIGIAQVAKSLLFTQASTSKSISAEVVYTAILSALARESSYVDPDGVLDQYNEATLNNFELRHFDLVLAEKRNGVWQDKFFNSAGEACTPGALNRDCNIRAQFNLFVDNAGALPHWKADFNVSLLQNPTSTTPVLLASTPARLSVSRKTTSLSTKKTSCDAGEVAMRGYAPNGDAICWEEAPISAACAEDEFVSGYSFDGASNQVHPVCLPLRGLECSDDYFSLEAVNPRYVDSRVAWNENQAADCVYMTKERVPAGHPSAPDHPQQCPTPGYELSGGECVLESDLINSRRPSAQ